MSNLLEKFTCPQCKTKGRVESVLKDCCVVDRISNVDPAGEVNYDFGAPEIHSGEVSCYQCIRCGEQLGDCTSEEELIEYLKGL